METIGVSKFKYWCILTISLVLCIVAIGIPACYFHYTKVYSDSNVNFFHVIICGVCLFFWIMVVSKGAEMPVKVCFLYDCIEVNTCFFFWETHKIVPYEEVEFHSSENQRIVSLHYGPEKTRFDPLLWSKNNRHRIANEMKRHNVEVLDAE